MKTLAIVLCLGALVTPAWADGAATTIDVEDDIAGPSAEYVAPSHDVPLYVPLTEDQQLLPTIATDVGLDYYPGIETPAGGRGPKEITDRVSQQ